MALVVIVLIVLIAAIAAGSWWNWQQQQTIARLQSGLDQGNQQRSQLSSSVQEGSQGIQNLRSQVSRLQSQFEQNDQALQQALNAFSSTQQTDARIWQLAEVEYLLRMANQRLQLERDVSGALALLRTADQRLEAIDNPALLPVRRAVASEISSLEAVPDVDESGLYLRLAALAERVDGLPLSQELQGQTAQQDSEALFSGGWRQQLARLGEQLQGLVTVRRHDEPLEALITPAQETYLRQNVQLLIEQAQLALMRDNGELYQSALQRAQSLVSSYFSSDNSNVSQLVDQLGTLAARNITPQLPDISESLNALREFQQQRQSGGNGSASGSQSGDSTNSNGGGAQNGGSGSGDDQGGQA